MTWQTIVDETLSATPQLSNLSIHGLDGTCYASSHGFEVLPTEAIHVARGIMKDPTNLYRGITLEKNQHSYICCEPGHSLICHHKKTGIVAIKTQRCILIGQYSNRNQEGICYAALDKLGEHFRGQEY